jgi:hypothetical protein
MLLSVKLGERGGWTGIMMKCNDVIATGNPPGFSQTFPDPDDMCGVSYLMVICIDLNYLITLL